MKVGIISLFHNSINYGGVLQGFALTKYLNNRGCDAKQILYVNNRIENRTILKRILQKNVVELFKLCIHYIVNRIIEKKDRQVTAPFNEKLRDKKDKFSVFREEVPHTNIVNNETISLLQDEYDVFVSGSDQVWNPNYWSDAYFLNFAHNKRKIAFAASLGVDDIPKAKRPYFKKMIDTFDIVTVREKKAKEIVETYTSASAKVVLDPTLLLTKDEWTEIEEEYRMDSPYIFCYLLGKDKTMFKQINDIAKLMKLPIVFLAFSHPAECYKEKNFGDIKLYDVGPKEFLYLIHHAEYVITDSFHCTVFSILYHRSFLCFDRYYLGKKCSNTRMCTLLERYCLSNCFFSRENSVLNKNIDWEKVDLILNEDRERMNNFWLDALKNME